jgi:hypothetical protein
MGVVAGKAKRGHFLGLAMLEFSRDLLIAATCFQSEYLERPNAELRGAALGISEARRKCRRPLERPVRLMVDAELAELPWPDFHLTTVPVGSGLKMHELVELLVELAEALVKRRHLCSALCDKLCLF